MEAIRTSLTANDLPDNLFAIRSEIERLVPHGRTDNGGVNDRGAFGEPERDAELEMHLRDLSHIVYRHPKLGRAAQRAAHHAGTLGTGNHFIEVCLDESDRVWFMLHSGSRGIGNAIGSYFINKAKEEMQRWFIHLPDNELAYLPQSSPLFSEYWIAVHWAQEFAKINRRKMMRAVIQAVKNTLPLEFSHDLEAISCHHNYVSMERHFGDNVIVTRKGAVNAEKGKLGIIPGSMGARSFIVEGKGNRESFCSCSHGAGRVMSRTQARNTFTLEDHARDTAGIECRKDLDVIDETPKAYKDIDAVMAAQADLVDIKHTLRQVLCVKG